MEDTWLFLIGLDKLAMSFERHFRKNKKKCWESQRNSCKRRRLSRQYQQLGFFHDSTTRGWWITTTIPGTLDPSIRKIGIGNLLLLVHPLVVMSWSFKLRLMIMEQSLILAIRPLDVVPLLLHRPLVGCFFMYWFVIGN